MQMDSLTLKQKLLRSRDIWANVSQSSFLVDLYEVLDSPNHEDIIAWSEDGKILLIKQYGLIEEEILPYFEYCLTVSSFAKQLQRNNFMPVSGKEYNVLYAFQHADYTRDKRPYFENLGKGKSSKKGSKDSIRASETEYGTVSKKVKKSATNLASLNEPNDEMRSFSRENVLKCIELLSFKRFMEIGLREMTLQTKLEQIFEFKK